MRVKGSTNIDDVRKELEALTISSLKKYVKEHGLKVPGISSFRKPNEAELRQRILQILQDPPPELFNADDIDFSQNEERTSDEVFVPLSFGEIIFMWELGFVCHPVVLKELLEDVGGITITGPLMEAPSCDWSALRAIQSDARLYFSTQSSRFSRDWIVPWDEVRIVVKDETGLTELLRQLSMTHQRFDQRWIFEAEVVDFSQEEVPTSPQAENFIESFPSEAKVDHSNLDAALGALAMLRHFERYLLVNSREFHSTTLHGGWLGAAILDSEPWRRRMDSKPAKNGDDPYCAWLQEVSKNVLKCISEHRRVNWDFRDDLRAIEDSEKTLQSLLSFLAKEITPVVENELIALIKRRRFNDALCLPEVKSLDSIAKYALLLCKHRQIRVRSSNARQSLYNDVFELLDRKILSQFEAKKIMFYHGWNVGYQLCVANPSASLIDQFGADESWWSIKMPIPISSDLLRGLLGKGQKAESRYHSNALMPEWDFQACEADGYGVVRSTNPYEKELRQIFEHLPIRDKKALVLMFSGEVFGELSSKLQIEFASDFKSVTADPGLLKMFLECVDRSRPT